MQRPKKRRFINRFVKDCTGYRNKRKGNRGSRRTNRVIRRKLKQMLKEGQCEW